MMVGLRLHASSAVPIPQQPHCSAAVYIGSSYLCGVGLIPTEAPDCSFSLNFGRALMAVPKLVERLWSREGANETETRAFGVEFEFHAAGAEVDSHRAVRKCFEEKFRDEYNFLEEEEKRVPLEWQITPEYSPHHPDLWQATSDELSQLTVPITLHQEFEAGLTDRMLASQPEGLHPMEATSPVLVGQPGLRSVAQLLAGMAHMGVQTGTSMGIHVHVNAGWGSEQKGDRLSVAQIRNVWAHYARFQLVINSMLQDSRINNGAAMPLVFRSHASFAVAIQGASASPSLRRRVYPYFKNDDLEVVALKNRWILDQLNKLAADGSPNWGDFPRQDFPRERQLNLVSLGYHGTLEFRAFPATTDAERVLRWITFVLRFVHTYKDMPCESQDCKNWKELEAAQLRATMDLLEKETGMHMEYWRERQWMDGDPACSPSDWAGPSP